MSTTKTGLTPQQWRDKLEAAAGDPVALADLLAALQREMQGERSALYDIPSPDSLLSSVLSFFSKPRQSQVVDDMAAILKNELARERQLQDRYRSWAPGETLDDRLCLFLKDFGGEVGPDETGLQFPEFRKYSGMSESDDPEKYTFFIHERFPGRDPANFRVQWCHECGDVILKRIYPMELPRVAELATTPARAVLVEMIDALCPERSHIRKLVVDNAANLDTRKAIMPGYTAEQGTHYVIDPETDVAATPLGHLMIKLSELLGLQAGEFTCDVLVFGMLRIELAVSAK